MASRVVLEITERASLDGLRDIRDRTKALRNLGFRLAVDDLGAGYAGLTSFASIEPEVVKIDMSLVRGIDANPVKHAIVDKLTALAHHLHILVVAEGIETPGERDALAAIDATCYRATCLRSLGSRFRKWRGSRVASALALTRRCRAVHFWRQNRSDAPSRQRTRCLRETFETTSIRKVCTSKLDKNLLLIAHRDVRKRRKSIHKDARPPTASTPPSW